MLTALRWSRLRFQFTAASGGGRISIVAAWSTGIWRFNPRPPVKAGETALFDCAYKWEGVSIHARQ